MIERSGSIPLTNGSGSGSQEAQKHVDPDSDPQHCPHVNITIYVCRVQDDCGERVAAGSPAWGRQAVPRQPGHPRQHLQGGRHQVCLALRGQVRHPPPSQMMIASFLCSPPGIVIIQCCGSWCLFDPWIRDPE
jgi:hypothetical protein